MSTANDAAVLENLPVFENAQSWTGPEMARRSDWIHEFTAPEIAEIDSALANVERTWLEILDIKLSDLPLPTVDRFLAQARR
jgi:hypothetical protein